MDKTKEEGISFDELEGKFLSDLKKEIKKNGGAKVVAEKANIPFGTLSKNLSGNTKMSLETALRIYSFINDPTLGSGGFLTDLLNRERKEDVARSQTKHLANREVQDVNPEIIRLLVTLADSVHRSAGITLPKEASAVEATLLYNELMKRVDDPTDMNEVISIFPQLEVRLKKRLAEAKAAPGTGKHQAS